jgi:hypothetical protein
MTNKQNILVSVLVTIVAMLGIFALIKMTKPEWLSKFDKYLLFDKDGFPRSKKDGDVFKLSNRTFIYKDGTWIDITSDGGPGGGPVDERLANFVLDANGVAIGDTTNKQICDPACLDQYPVGSQFYPNYYCVKTCGRASF